MKLAELLEAMNRFVEQEQAAADHEEPPVAKSPCCPHCGSQQTKLLLDWPRLGVP